MAHTLTLAAADGRGAVRGAIEGGVAAAEATEALKEKKAAEIAAAVAAAPALRQEWLATPLMLTPLLADLHADGVQEVHIVPGGDWHLAPWAASLDEHVPGLRVRQFPTTAGWWRTMTEPVAAQPTRWAALAHDAADTPKPLMWVEPEVTALAQLWGPVTLPSPQGAAQLATQLERLDASAPAWPPHGQSKADVQALVGIGHGNAPEGNWSQAGLVRGGKGAELSYFTGMDLHRISTAHRLVMSCCVLGRVRDWQGEPMGMTALAFAFKARLAVGAMVPVPDFEGAIFSMALHHAWATQERRCVAAADKPMDWSGVFHATRRSVMAGQWPPGFGAWLGQALPELTSGVHDLDLATRGLGEMSTDAYINQLATAPTSELREVASMFTCLG